MFDLNCDTVFQGLEEFNPATENRKAIPFMGIELQAESEKGNLDLMIKRASKSKDLWTGRVLPTVEFVVQQPSMTPKTYAHVREYYKSKRDDGKLIIDVPRRSVRQFLAYCRKHKIKVSKL